MWSHLWPPEHPQLAQRPAAPPEITILRVSDRFGVGIEGAMHHLGYPPPTPRILKQITLWCTDAAAVEGFYHRWQAKPDDPGFTPDEAQWFKEEVINAAWACPGCGALPGSFHADGCPEDKG